MLLAAVVSLLLLHPARGAPARRLSRPHSRLRGASRTWSATRTTSRFRACCVFRVEAALLYFNVEHVRDAVWSKIRSSPAPVRLVVCDLSASPNVDVAGARMLAKLHGALQSAGIAFRLAGAHAAVRDILRAEGLEERAGYFGRRITAVDVVDEFEGFAQPAGSSAGKVMS